MNRIDASQYAWDLDHPVMAQNNQDLLELAVLYEGEHYELLQAWVGFLCEPSEASKEDVLQEGADVILFITQLCHLLGTTLEDTVMDKRGYNTTRYIAANFQGDMSYQDGRQASREWVKERNWKDTFYSIDALCPGVDYTIYTSQL